MYSFTTHIPEIYVNYATIWNICPVSAETRLPMTLSRFP